jgi:hypothetical protein
MAEHMQALIDELQDKIAVLAGYYPEAKGLFDSARTAIVMSSPRALLNERRSSIAGRMSIVSTLGSIFFAVTRHDDAGRHIARLSQSILKLASTIADGIKLDDEPYEVVTLPDGWKIGADGNLVRTLADGSAFVVTKRPHLPGGDWCLHYFNVPISFGETLEDIFAKQGQFERLIADAARPITALPVPAVAPPRKDDGTSDTHLASA